MWAAKYFSEPYLFIYSDCRKTFGSSSTNMTLIKMVLLQKVAPWKTN